jgi:NAD(P)-dependent dehydrogenase (short-subunit alcohol dehydrogenase family)
MPAGMATAPGSPTCSTRRWRRSPAAVRVNAIQCGPFLTDISTAWDPEARDAFANTLALRRCAEPHEIVGAAMYLTGDEASFCTGAVLRLDGGVP